MGTIQSIKSNEDICVCIKSISNNNYSYELIRYDKISNDVELRTHLDQYNIEKDLILFKRSYVYLGNKDLFDKYINSQFAVINDISKNYDGFINRLINGIIIAYKDNLNNSNKNELSEYK
jgi:hypothetical protein